ncbi:MAG: argininosuccinate lyase [Acidobacteria bacterium]|nr:argininosuccinate lyase [Acidobacteriota bacterium]
MTLWSGRFDEKPDDVLWSFTADVSDRRLLVDDLNGSIAHVKMLASVGILSDDESGVISDGLEVIAQEARSGSFEFKESDEDVHSAVERRLEELIGELAGKLHTGRSRNDQICLDLRLYLRRTGERRVDQIKSLMGVLVDKAEEVGDTVSPSYTHLQQAQAIPFAHHLLAYAWMLKRDAERFVDARRRIDVSPLGASASAGSSLPLDPDATAELLGFALRFDNSLDAVASRDFVSEYAFCCAQTMVTLSRMSEELVLWATTEFDWVSFPDRHTTGSSAMPHKKNPDMAELVRGKSAVVLAASTGLLALQKGLPMTYNRDLQEDKGLVFQADDNTAGSLAAIATMVEAADFHPKGPVGWVTALDLAEVLVERGVPFRVAHEAVGRLVNKLVSEGRTMGQVTGADLVAAHPQFTNDDVEFADPTTSMERRITPGGGSMNSVRTQLAALRSYLR